jgi:hypothetical protein
MEMLRTPREEEFLPFGGGEGLMVCGPPTACIALAFNKVGKADADRLVGVPGVPQVRSIVGADGGWGVDEAVKKITNTNWEWAKTAEVRLKIIRIWKRGVGPGASSSR